jgi:uncharacterized membrane protein SpoIIM required for sporulation
MKLDLSFWKNASPRRKRIYSTIFIFLVAVLLTVIGSYVPLSHQDATSISNDINQTRSTYEANGGLTQYIFLNNFSICLLMFIPIIGPLLGFYILFNTGIALGAIATTSGYPVILVLISLAITPVFWLEFATYSIAITESIWLVRRIMQRRWRELKNTGILIGICAALLIIGAIVEAWIITAFG